jgi:hypothetical protein
MVVELRILGVIDNPNYPPFTLAGCYDYEHLDKLAQDAMTWTPKAEGCYVTINPVKADLLARAANRLVKRPKHATTDSEITCRVGLVIDADPKRPPGVSATDAEKAAARERIDRIVAEMARRGWPDPIVADSGNGFHARYKIDLPTDDGGLIERVLKAANAMFSDAQVEIDAKLFNPSRIIKLYGTLARKGDSVEDRPHRWSRVVEAPDDFQVVSRELLEAFAASHEPAPSRPAVNGQPQVSACRPAPRGGASPKDQARAYVFSPGFPDSIAGENGHGVLYRVACELVDGFGLSYEQALPILMEWNESKAKPPESQAQLEHKLSDAVKKYPVPSCRRLNPRRRSRRSDSDESRQWPVLTPDTVVRCIDRDPPNYGYVEEDLGDSAHIRWESPSGYTETGTLHKTQLRRQDGSDLTAVGSGDLVLATSLASSIRPVPVDFLDGGVLPRGKLVTLAGLGGCGKGMFWANIVADLTRGRSTLGLTYEPLPPIEVLLVGCEDGYADTVIPRLRAADADLDRVHILEGVKDQDGRLSAFSLAHLDPLAAYLKDRTGVRLVIIDPIAGYMGRAGVKDHHDTEVRTILEPLADLANRCGATILTVKHLNKDEAKTVASRVGGSVAYVNVSRACFVIATDPADDERRILAPFKWNLNAPRPPSIAWVMEPPAPEHLASILASCDHLGDQDKEKLAGQLHRLNWLGEAEGNADDLIRAAAKAGRKANQDEIERATEWLRQRLADGPIGSILAAREGDRFLGRRWTKPGLTSEERRRFVFGRTKWWRENILKGQLGGETKQAGFHRNYLFRLPDHQWPPNDDVLEAARRAADEELTSTGATESTGTTREGACPNEASVELEEGDL